MRNIRQKTRLAVVLLALAPAAAVFAAASTTFARVDTDEQNEPRALQLAIVSYSPTDDSNFTVDLISAIHIGDSSYYAELNERFRDYDALLFELVAPENTVVTSRVAERKGFISTAQIGNRELEEKEL